MVTHTAGGVTIESGDLIGWDTSSSDAMVRQSGALGERFSLVQWVGGLLILVSMALVTRREKDEGR